MAPAIAPDALPAPVRDGVPAGARRIAFVAALLALPATLAALAFGADGAALAAMVGSALALANFFVLARLAVAASAGGATASGLVAQLLGKFAALGVLLGLAVLVFDLEPLGLLLGLSVVLLAIPFDLLAGWVASAR